MRIVTSDYYTDDSKIFWLIESDGDIEKKMMDWDGTDVVTFINGFSNENFSDMETWSMNHAFGSIGTSDFPNLDWDDESTITTEIKVITLKGFISDCLMMAVQGQGYFDVISQKEVVSHFYKLWMAVNGDAD